MKAWNLIITGSLNTGKPDLKANLHDVQENVMTQFLNAPLMGHF
jgi:hypothetical protein